MRFCKEIFRLWSRGNSGVLNLLAPPFGVWGKFLKSASDNIMWPVNTGKMWGLHVGPFLWILDIETHLWCDCYDQFDSDDNVNLWCDDKMYRLGSGCVNIVVALLSIYLDVVCDTHRKETLWLSGRTYGRQRDFRYGGSRLESCCRSLTQCQLMVEFCTSQPQWYVHNKPYVYSTKYFCLLFTELWISSWLYVWRSG